MIVVRIASALGLGMLIFFFFFSSSIGFDFAPCDGWERIRSLANTLNDKAEAAQALLTYQTLLEGKFRQESPCAILNQFLILITAKFIQSENSILLGGKEVCAEGTANRRSKY